MKKLLTLILAVGFHLSHSQQTIVHAGLLIDGTSDKVYEEMSIVIEGDKIVDVKKGFVSGGNVINMRGATVMPGWIDMHVHLEGETSPDRYLKTFTQNPSDVAYEAAEIAERTLRAGFTTVRDVGGSGVNVSLRNAINKGLV